MRFSASVMTIERRSAPIMILSLARSNWSIDTWRWLARAANSAASLTRLARSAPEKPGVPRAISAGLTSSPSGIDFVDEYDARGVLLGLLEHVAHARSADADEHLDEVGAGDGEERHLGFARDCTRQQRLAGTGRADH